MNSQQNTAALDRDMLEAGYRKCSQCNLIAKVGRHGMVDCVAELQRQIGNLRNERDKAQIELVFAQETLASLHAAFRAAFDE